MQRKAEKQCFNIFNYLLFKASFKLCRAIERSLKSFDTMFLLNNSVLILFKTIQLSLDLLKFILSIKTTPSEI